jgi:hypothetical protein
MYNNFIDPYSADRKDSVSGRQCFCFQTPLPWVRGKNQPFIPLTRPGRGGFQEVFDLLILHDYTDCLILCKSETITEPWEDDGEEENIKLKTGTYYYEHLRKLPKVKKGNSG